MDRIDTGSVERQKDKPFSLYSEHNFIDPSWYIHEMLLSC